MEYVPAGDSVFGPLDASKASNLVACESQKDLKRGGLLLEGIMIERGEMERKEQRKKKKGKRRVQKERGSASVNIFDRLPELTFKSL